MRPKSTLQSATGLNAARIVQTSMGMTAGSYNTREFMHGVAQVVPRRIRLGFLTLGFGLPALLLAALLLGANPLLFLAIAVLQFPGLIAERWFFFAQARHPQNLYYLAVS